MNEPEFNPLCPFCAHRVDHGEQMICTRFPPTPLVVMQQVQRKENILTADQPRVEMQQTVISVFPVVTPETSCGEFEDAEYVSGDDPATVEH